MIPDDLKRIETELGIKLPEAYRDALCPFPIKSLSGNTDTELWDNPTAIIMANMDFRTGKYGNTPWPSHLLAIGQVDGDPSVYAMDLRQPPFRVFWLDHGDPAAAAVEATPNAPMGFSSWLESLIPRLREGVEAYGISADSDPSVRRKAETSSGKSERYFLVGMIVVGVIGVVLYKLLTAH